MWSYRLSAPRTFERIEKEQPRRDEMLPGDVLPAYRGVRSALPQDTGRLAAGIDGYPMHEVVGEVIASADDSIGAGELVVGWASRFDALSEFILTAGSGLTTYPAMPAVEAVGLQPLACVLFAMDALPDLAGRTVAVIGQGPIGVLFSHVAKSRGARHVIGVDPIDRTDVASAFGVDEPIRSTAGRWAAHLDDAERPSVVIEAVGHQVQTLGDAITATAPEGFVYYFGIGDDDVYPINMRALLRKNLTLISGVTLRRQAALAGALRYAAEHPKLLASYATTVLPVAEVGAAFEEACGARPGRLKVVLEMSA